jgi:adenylate kinase
MLSLDVEEEELKKRLIKRAEVSGRADDADPKIIDNRIAVYHKETSPVKSFYEQQGKLISIAGMGSVDEITGRLFTAINAI